MTPVGLRGPFEPRVEGDIDVIPADGPGLQPRPVGPLEFLADLADLAVDARPQRVLGHAGADGPFPAELQADHVVTDSAEADAQFQVVS